MTDTLTGHDVEEGELPEGWVLSSIGEQCEVVAGSTPKSAVEEYWGGDIAWLTPKDLSQNPDQFVECGERSITQSGYESCSARLVPAGSVLFTSRAPIGYVAIAANAMCTNQGFKTAVPGLGLQSEFLYWQLQHVTPDIRSRASGTTFPEISGKKFAATEIVVPTREEQERIVEILEDQLSRLDTALQSVHTVREKAAQFRRSLLHAAFTGALTGHDVEQGELPEGWVLSSIGEQCEVVAGSTPKSAVEEYWGGDIAWLTPKDLSQNPDQFVECGERSITQSGYESCSARLVPAGSVLFTSRAPIGYVAIAANAMCTNQGFKTAVPGLGLQSEFLYWQLQHVTPDIRSRASGTTFPEISGKKFAATEIVVPTREEQERIVEILEDQLSRLDTALQSVHTVREKAAQFRRSLLHAAFTGALTGHDVQEGELPSGWGRRRIADVLAELPNGKVLNQGKSPQCEKEPSPSDEIWGVLKTTAIQPGEFVSVHNKRLPSNREPDESIEVASGDLLLTCAGPRVRCGVPCLVRETRPRLMLSGKMYRFRPNEELVGAEFLEGYLLSPSAQELIEGMKTGTSDSGLNLTHGRFSELPVPLPPLEEQERIVEILEDQLSRLDASLAVADAVEERSAALRRSLLHSAFTGRLTRVWREAVNV